MKCFMVDELDSPKELRNCDSDQLHRGTSKGCHSILRDDIAMCSCTLCITTSPFV